MTSAGDDDPDAVLSDVEEDETVPIAIKDPSPEDISVEKFRELMAELERERQARVASENSKAELQVQFDRLKTLARQAIQKRDEWAKQRDDALREKEELLESSEKMSAELIDANKVKEELLDQKDQIAKQLDEAVKSRDSLRSEIETSAHMLVTGIEKISGKVSNFKNFSAGGLPRSQKYSGLPAVSYGVIKRTNEIAEEIVKQFNAMEKSRNEAREQIEQRNYEIAIEVSQLEAAIAGLREEVAKKSSDLEKLETALSEKDVKTADNEKLLMEKVNDLERENSELKELFGEVDDKLISLESRMEAQRPLLNEQLDFVSKIHGKVCDFIKIVDVSGSDTWDLSDSLFMPQETDVEENIHASLAGMKSIYELMDTLVEKTRDLVDEKNHEIKGINETVDRLMKEKDQIGSFLRSALSKRMTLDSSSENSQLFQVAENGLKEAGIDFKFSKFDGEDEIYTLAGALENIVKTSQLEIIDQKHCIEELKAELSSLKSHIEAQTKELNLRNHQIEELEEKEKTANESIEGLMMDIASAEEEITRWKVAAEEEAAAGKAIEQEFTTKLDSLRKELEEAKHVMLELEKKLKSKEETATAAMAARDAAEKSLKLADLRASRLRDRIEELTHQIEESESQGSARTRSGPRYVCWPWQWLGLDFVGIQRSSVPQLQGSNEMELSEPLL